VSKVRILTVEPRTEFITRCELPGLPVTVISTGVFEDICKLSTPRKY
jgi:hypothetical protein